MTHTSSSLDEARRAVSALWAIGPDYTLLRYAQLAPEGPVFDAGIGDGRNALLLAKAGREVEGVDASADAVQRCLERAKEEGLALTATVGDLRGLAVPEGRYALVIAAWVLHFLPPADSQAVVRALVGGLKEGGLVYVAVFTPADPAYARAAQRFEPAGENAFYLRKIDRYLRFFTSDDVAVLFAGLETIYLAQGTQLDFGHDEPHPHGFIEYIGRRA